MRNRRIMGVFDRPSDAEKVKDELLEAGVARHRIIISSGVKRSHSDERCVLEVVARSPVDRKHIARLMMRHGARETVEPRA